MKVVTVFIDGRTFDVSRDVVAAAGGAETLLERLVAGELDEEWILVAHPSYRRQRFARVAAVSEAWLEDVDDDSTRGGSS